LRCRRRARRRARRHKIKSAAALSVSQSTIVCAGSVASSMRASLSPCCPPLCVVDTSSSSRRRARLRIIKATVLMRVVDVGAVDSSVVPSPSSPRSQPPSQHQNRCCTVWSVMAVLNRALSWPSAWRCLESSLLVLSSLHRIVEPRPGVEHIPSKICRRTAITPIIPANAPVVAAVDPTVAGSSTQTRWSARTRVAPPAIRPSLRQFKQSHHLSPPCGRYREPSIDAVEPGSVESGLRLGGSSYCAHRCGRRRNLTCRCCGRCKPSTAAADAPSVGADGPISSFTRRVHRYIPSSPPIRCAFSDRARRCESHRLVHRASRDHAICLPILPALPPVVVFDEDSVNSVVPLSCAAETSLHCCS
jgi:hypothetical protein